MFSKLSVALLVAVAVSVNADSHVVCSRAAMRTKCAISFNDIPSFFEDQMNECVSDAMRARRQITMINDSGSGSMTGSGSTVPPTTDTPIVTTDTPAAPTTTETTNTETTNTETTNTETTNTGTTTEEPTTEEPTTEEPTEEPTQPPTGTKTPCSNSVGDSEFGPSSNDCPENSTTVPPVTTTGTSGPPCIQNDDCKSSIATVVDTLACMRDYITDCPALVDDLSGEDMPSFIQLQTAIYYQDVCGYTGDDVKDIQLTPELLGAVKKIVDDLIKSKGCNVDDTITGCEDLLALQEEIEKRMTTTSVITTPNTGTTDGTVSSSPSSASFAGASILASIASVVALLL
eukprot:m.332008 g.332008  ORF g.332008 m.332008 type:complete len:345 (+) comp16848_c0_seq1:63-1097(+)